MGLLCVWRFGWGLCVDGVFVIYGLCWWFGVDLLLGELGGLFFVLILLGWFVC